MNGPLPAKMPALQSTRTRLEIIQKYFMYIENVFHMFGCSLSLSLSLSLCLFLISFQMLNIYSVSHDVSIKSNVDSTPNQPSLTCPKLCTYIEKQNTEKITSKLNSILIQQLLVMSVTDPSMPNSLLYIFMWIWLGTR